MERGAKAIARVAMKIAPLKSEVLSHGDLYIAEWLDRFDMDQADLMRETGLSEGYISAIITGKHGKNPTLGSLRKVARAIGVPVWALFLPPSEAGLQSHLIKFMALLAARK